MSKIIDDFNRDIAKIKTLKQKIAYVSKKFEEITKKQMRLQDQVDKAERTPTGQGIFQAALEKTIKRAPEILWDQIKNAATKNIEFNHEVFLKRLQIVKNDPNLINIVQLKNGHIKVIFNFDQVAGSLADYGRAISKVRRQLNEEVSPKDMRDWFWKEKFYAPAREGSSVLRRRAVKGSNRGLGRGRYRARKTSGDPKYEKYNVTGEQIRKYWDTISKRLDATGKIAPFWQILDQGNMSIPGTERGTGTGYPVNHKTDFTGMSKILIEAYYDTQVNNFTKEAAKTAGINVEQAKKQIAEMQEASIAFYEVLERLHTASLDEAVYITSMLADRQDEIDMNKVDAFIASIKAKNLEGINFGSRDRVQVGKRGHDVRIRTSDLLNRYNIKR